MPRSAGRTATATLKLSPAYFPFVMATSIISTGMFLMGPSWLSRALLVIASAALVVLIVAQVIQLVWFRSGLAAAVRDPGRVFGFFTIAAGMDVLGIRLAAAGHPLATAILAGLAAAVWLALTYGVPARLLLARSRDSVVGDVNGTWLLWVVATGIIVLTGARILRLPAALAAVKAAAGFRRGILLRAGCTALPRWPSAESPTWPSWNHLAGSCSGRPWPRGWRWPPRSPSGSGARAAWACPGITTA